MAQYADLYLEYDAGQRVTKEVVAGGSRGYTFDYQQRVPGYTYVLPTELRSHFLRNYGCRYFGAEMAGLPNC